MLFNSLLAAAALASTAFAAPAEERQTSARKMKWFGINESGAEFGEKNFTGVYGKEYTWYDLNTIDKFMAEGMNMFRLNFRKLSDLDTQYHNRSKMVRLITSSNGAPNSQLPHGRV